MSDPVTPFALDRSVNETILADPQSLPIFSALGLDTCCRGNMSIRAAAAAAGIRMQDLLDALEGLQRQTASPPSSSTGSE